eukprot:UN15384
MADLDVRDFKWTAAVEHLQSNSTYDVICVFGTTMRLEQNYHPYKDTFATVFYPDTFNHNNISFVLHDVDFRNKLMAKKYARRLYDWSLLEYDKNMRSWTRRGIQNTEKLRNC